MDRTVTRQAINEYLRAGYEIVRLKPGKKNPVDEKWPENTITSWEQADMWWPADGSGPDYNVGIATAGLLVLDVDGRENNYLDTVDSDDLRGAPIVHSARGGIHIWTKPPAGHKLPTTKGRLAKGVDTRGEGGLIVAPPSEFEGKPYAWDADNPFKPKSELRTTPAWLHKALGEYRASPSDLERHAAWCDGPRQPQAVAEVTADMMHWPECISGVNGQNEVFAAMMRLAQWATDRSLCEDDAWALARHWNATKTDGYPWDESGDAPASESLLRVFQRARGRWLHAGNAVDSRVAEEFGDLSAEAGEQSESPYKLDLITTGDLLDGDYEQKFLIRDLIVERNHLIIAGAPKCFKTTLLIDIALSLASGKKALGHYEVPEPKKSIIVSGESGLATIKSTVQRIMKVRKIARDELEGRLFWGKTLPNLTMRGHLDHLEHDVRATGAEFVAIDPAYLAFLLGDDSTNVTKVGEVLGRFGAISEKTGCTLCLCHHITKASAKQKWPTMTDVSQAGFSEWMRQWILLAHEGKYAAGKTTINANVGGSAGHGARYQWEVSQGQRAPDGMGWTGWDVAVSVYGEDKQVETAPEEDFDEVAALAALMGDEGWTPNAVKKSEAFRAAGFGRDRFCRVVESNPDVFSRTEETTPLGTRATVFKAMADTPPSGGASDPR